MSKEPEVTIMRIIINLMEAGSHYIGYVLLAVIGGLMNYLGKVREGKVGSFKFWALLADLSISGFAGVLVALLANHYKLSSEMVYFLAGSAGHFGARTIFLLQAAIVAKLVSLKLLPPPK